MSYFEDLAHDLNIANLYGDPGKLTDVGYRHYEDAASMIDHTRNIGDPERLLPTPPVVSQARTPLGRHIFRLLGQPNPVEFDTNPTMSGCYEAETKLLVSLHDSTRDNRHHAPIIITEGPKAVGIIKGYGEPTCYALQTNIERGLIRGTFSVIPVNIQPDYLPRISGAWKIPLTDIQSVEPIRFSTFMMPVNDRRRLQPPTHEYSHPGIITLSHQAIVKAATRRLRTALPVEL